MIKKFIYTLFIAHFLLLLFTLEASAQLPAKIEHFSTEDGLSHDIITCMFKDQEGYMWFGTWNGINRFDGQNFTAFKSAAGDKSQLKSGRIDQITEDNSNHLWLKGYDGEIYRFDKATEQFLALSSILKLNKKIAFSKILSSDDNMLWVTTLDQGILCVPNIRNKPEAFIIYNNLAKGSFRLPSNKTNFFYKSNHSTIWIGTPEGLVCLTKNISGEYLVKQFKKTADRAGYTAVAKDDNKLYFATTQGKILVFDVLNNTFTQTFTISSGRINALLIAKSRRTIFATTATGELVTINIQTAQIIKTQYPQHTPLLAIFEDKQQNLWLEPEKHGAIRFDVRKKTFSTFEQKNDAKFNNPGNHYSVFEDNKGTVWAVLKDGGFGYYNPLTNKLDYFYNEPGSRNRSLSNIVTVAWYDPTGVLWLHTDERGIEKIIFQPNEFQQHLLVNPGTFKSDNEVRGLLFDKQNRLWIGAKSGILYVFDHGREVSNIFVNSPKDGLGSVYTIMQDHQGSIWLGTKANGLYRADPVDVLQKKYRLTHFGLDDQNPDAIRSKEIYSLIEDKQGRVWVGTYDNGLEMGMIDNGTFTFKHFYQGKNGYPNRFYKIRHMALDKRGRLWIGTTDGLVVADIENKNKVEFNTFVKQPNDSHSLGNNDIQYIYRDDSGKMWLATSGGGLNLAVEDRITKGLSFKTYTTKNGLANDYLLSCTEDLSHNIWVTTKSSLSCFNIRREIFKNYNSYDGVPNSSFSEASCQKINDGQLVFGTIKGYISFNPNRMRNYPIKANMVLTNLQINNADVTVNKPESILSRTINYMDNLKLKYNQNIISIDYAVLDFRSGNRQSYLYRLKGFEPKWYNNENRLRATYTNIPPGNYVFEVKCVDKERYLNIPQKSIAITILPPPWQTWWAYLCYLLLSVIILESIRRTAFTMLRLRQKIAVERQLTELKLSFFTNISHELRTPLTLILNPVNEILKQEQLSEQGREYFTIMRRNANRMARFVNQLLDLRKVQSGKAKLRLAFVDMVAFINCIGENFKQQAREKEIIFTVNAANQTIYTWVDADKIETVIYNLFSNAYKFSPVGKHITVNIFNGQANETLIEVNDEGCGVLPNDLENIFELYHEGGHPNANNLKGTGIGLALAKELVKLHDGKISAKNLVSGGLSVLITLPFQNKDSEETKTTESSNSGNLLKTTLPELVLATDIAIADEEVAGHVASLVLLVEDNSDMRLFLKRQLSSAYRVEVAENGMQGLEQAKLIQPDLILSDIMMPEMDGIEMLYHLRNCELTSHIPVVLLSAKSAIESQVKGLAYGADYYITKPFENELLFAAVANILDKRKKFAEHIASGTKVIALSPGEVVVTSKDELFLKKIVAIVEERMADPDFNIDTVAEQINMARATFYKKFKNLTQLAPVEFVREMRLKRAKQCLDAGSGNITEIAYKVGFSSGKYFSTCFKAKYHLSPSSYLKTLKPVD